MQFRQLTKSDAAADTNVYIVITTPTITPGAGAEPDISHVKSVKHAAVASGGGAGTGSGIAGHAGVSEGLPGGVRTTTLTKMLVPDAVTLQILELGLGPVTTMASADLSTIPVITPYPALTFDSLITLAGSGQIYLLTAAGRRLIPDSVTMKGMGFSAQAVITLESSIDMSMIKLLGAFPSWTDKTLISTLSENNPIYMMASSTKHLIPDSNTLAALRLDHQTVFGCSDADFAAIPLGAPCPAISFQSPYPITGQQGNDLNADMPGVVGKMKTTVSLDIDGNLTASTHIFTTNRFAGFTGGVVVVLLDSSNKILGQTDVGQYGVSAMSDGAENDRTIPWTYKFDSALLPLVSGMKILQFYDPKGQTIAGFFESLVLDIAFTFIGIPPIIFTPLIEEIIINPNIAGSTPLPFPTAFKGHIAEFESMAQYQADGQKVTTGLSREPVLHIGGPLIESISNNASAITIDNHIFIESGYYNNPGINLTLSDTLTTAIGERKDQNELLIEALIAHELTHVYQYGKMGLTSFLIAYYGEDFLFLLLKAVTFGQDDPDLFTDNFLEKEAYEVQTEFIEFYVGNIASTQ